MTLVLGFFMINSGNAAIYIGVVVVQRFHQLRNAHKEKFLKRFQALHVCFLIQKSFILLQSLLHQLFQCVTTSFCIFLFPKQGTFWHLKNTFILCLLYLCELKYMLPNSLLRFSFATAHSVNLVYNVIKHVILV